MANTMVAPKTFVLKLIQFRCPCKECEKKLKNLLLNIPGVHSTAIDTTQDTVTISGTVDPYTVIEVLEAHKTKSELLLEQISPKINHHQKKQITSQIQPQPPVIDQEFHGRNLVAEMQQLSGINGLKHVEVTYSKTVKLTFKKDKNDDELSEKSGTHKKIVMNNDDDNDDDVISTREVHRRGGTTTSQARPPGCYSHHDGPTRGWSSTPPRPRDFSFLAQPVSGYDPSAPPWSGPYRTCAHKSGEEKPSSCCFM